MCALEMHYWRREVADEALQLTRLCGFAMNHMVRQVLELGNQALHFDGDDPEQWVVINAKEVRCISNGRLVADLTLVEPNKLLIVVPNDEDLIRSEHLPEYSRKQHGIIGPGPKDWKGDREPALAMLWELPENTQIRQGPRQHIPTTQMSRKPKYIRTIH